MLQNNITTKLPAKICQLFEVFVELLRSATLLRRVRSIRAQLLSNGVYNTNYTKMFNMLHVSQYYTQEHTYTQFYEVLFCPVRVYASKDAPELQQSYRLAAQTLQLKCIERCATTSGTCEIALCAAFFCCFRTC